MFQKVTVGLQQKIGQPNFGSFGASCSIEVHLEDEEVMRPEQIAQRVKQAFAQCRECIAKELASHETSSPQPDRSVPKPSADTKRAAETKAANGRAPRTATEAQIRAIRAIATKAGLSLASELEQGYGVRNPHQLTISQASQLIDSLKQSLTPSPA